MKRVLAGKPKIFIGSSGNAYELVKWLAEQIRNYDLAIPVEWKSGGFAPSKSTLQNLLEQCSVCDFAVIFFTRDDDKAPTVKTKTNPLGIFKGPRDNTIFEAGLFVGGLGLQPERCILVSSVDESALPSDIKGVTYVEIEEPPPTEPPFDRLSEEWCREHLQKVLESVIFSVNNYGEFLNRPILKVLTKMQLAEREQVGQGCLEKYDRVVINSSEPEDLCDFVLAQSVARNIKDHIYYDFHFRIGADNRLNVASQLIDLIRILLATYCIGEESYTEGDLKREKDIKDFLDKKDKEEIDDAISHFKKQLRIHIHKYKHPIPFRIAVHNVSSLDRARCYLRHDDHFVEWFLKEEAREAIDILKKEDDAIDESTEGRIFQSTETFDLYEDLDFVNNDWEFLSNNNETDLQNKDQENRNKKKFLDDCKKFQETINKYKDKDKDKDNILYTIKRFPNAYIKKFIDNELICNEPIDLKTCSKLHKELKKRLVIVFGEDNEDSYGYEQNEKKNTRKILMENIIELFSDELREKIRGMCFGEENEIVNREWEDITKNEVTSKKDRLVSYIMEKCPEHEGETVKQFMEKFDIFIDPQDHTDQFISEDASYGEVCQKIYGSDHNDFWAIIDKNNKFKGILDKNKLKDRVDIIKKNLTGTEYDKCLQNSLNLHIVSAEDTFESIDIMFSEIDAKLFEKERFLAFFVNSDHEITARILDLKKYRETRNNKLHEYLKQHNLKEINEDKVVTELASLIEEKQVAVTDKDKHPIEIIDVDKYKESKSEIETMTGSIKENLKKLKKVSEWATQYKLDIDSITEMHTPTINENTPVSNILKNIEDRNLIFVKYNNKFRGILDKSKFLIRLPTILPGNITNRSELLVSVSENDEIAFVSDKFQDIDKKLHKTKYSLPLYDKDSKIRGILDKKVFQTWFNKENQERYDQYKDEEIGNYIGEITYKVKTSFAFISKLKKISFAKEIFRANPDCQMIYVTDNDNENKKIKGCITKDILLKESD
jgi:hypothetical protein